MEKLETKKRKLKRKMFYLVGLGLSLESLSKEALEICKEADKIYVEKYTAELPYDTKALARFIGKDIYQIPRLIVEREEFLEEGKKKDIVLLVYGSPLIATTHISLILKCEKEEINYKILHNASILDAISETGLQIYKFGKTASMPKWDEKYKPTSFLDLIKFNKAIKAHTLILVDIGITFPEALKQLEKVCKKKAKINKMIVCSQLGTKNSRIYYNKISELFGAEVFSPFCFIIPSELHFLEKEVLKSVIKKI